MLAHVALTLFPGLLLIVGGVILFVLMVKFLLVVGLALFHPHGLGLFAAVVVLLFVLVALFHVRQMRSVPMAPAVPIVVPQQPMLVETHLAPAGERLTTTLTKPTDSGTPTESIPSTHSISGSPPAWINQQQPQKQGNSWVYVVHLDAADTNPAVRDDMLDAKISLAAEQFMDEHLYPDENLSKTIKLDADYLRANCLRQTYPALDNVAPGKEIYAQLVFDNKFRDELERRYRQIVSWDHLQQLGDVAIVGLAMLGGLYVYLRTTAKKHKANAELEAQAAKA